MKEMRPKDALRSDEVRKIGVLKKDIKASNSTAITTIDNMITKLKNLNKKMKTFRQNEPLCDKVRHLLWAFIELRCSYSEFISSLLLEMEYYMKLTLNPRPHKNELPTFEDSGVLKVIFNLLNEPIYTLRVTQPSAHLLEDILEKVLYDEESETSIEDIELQTLFENVFIRRNAHISKSLGTLNTALQKSMSFSSIEGFCRAVASKLIYEYKLKKNINQLLHCIYRVVYPLVYTINPQFFPSCNSVRNPNLTPRDVTVEPYLFKTALDLIQQLTYMITPIDMLSVLYRGGSLLVDAYMAAKGGAAEMGAQELLPILEAAVIHSQTPLLLSTLSWLDQYCMEAEASASASYITASFLTVASAALMLYPQKSEDC